MSQHLNSMLEHLRVGPLKRIMPNDGDDGGQQKQPEQQLQQQPQQEGKQPSTALDSYSSTMNAKGNGAILTSVDEVDNSRVSVVISDTRKKSLKEIPNGVVGILDTERKFDSRKRYSISNGDLRIDGKARELSPAATIKQQQRKLSADMRLRGSNSQLTDDYLLRRPVRLRSMCTNFEVYDSLHTKAMDVSTFKFKLQFSIQYVWVWMPGWLVFVVIIVEYFLNSFLTNRIQSINKMLRCYLLSLE